MPEPGCKLARPLDMSADTHSNTIHKGVKGEWVVLGSVTLTSRTSTGARVMVDMKRDIG